MITHLDVLLWNRKVGTLVVSKKGYKNQICFYFDPEFAKSGYDVAPLRASISAPAAQNGFPIYPEEDKLFGGLPSFIADSMPDHWGNLIFKEWAKQRGIRSKDLNALDRLAYIGRRGMGALEFIPPTSEGLETPFKIEITELAQLAATALEEAKHFHASIKSDFMVESLFKVGTSAGGRRPKAVINMNQETGECYSGQVPIELPGFTPMIIKFDERGSIPTTRIEYSYYLMASTCGIKMMPSRLIETSGHCHFLTERFDRKGNEKIHIQTLAAMNPLSDSYEDLFKVAKKLKVLPEELSQLFMQMVMNVACGNVDDHNKNFSFMMDKDGVWHVAPAYDFTFSVDLDAPFYVNRHSMTINGKNEEITRDDLLEIAQAYDIKNAPSLIDSVVATATNYREYAQKAGVPAEWIIKIQEEIEQRCQLLSI